MGLFLWYGLRSEEEVENLSEIAARRIYYLAAVAIVAMVLISAVAVVRPPAVETGTNASPKTIQVTGTATLSAPPDEALLNLAVESRGATATEATANNAASMSEVMGALASTGVTNDSIQTVSYTLTPIYENNVNQSAPSIIIGYTALNAIQVTVKDLGSIGKIIDQTTSAGVNEVQGITFTLSDTDLAALQKQALQLAVQDADGQAKAMATTLGINITGPISVTPGYTFQPTNYSRLAAASAAETPIQPGTLQVTATVQVTYQFA
jgi:hypothetical protein